MKYLLASFFLFSTYVAVAADAGYAYRFNVDVELHDGSKVYGYVFNWSEKEYDPEVHYELNRYFEGMTPNSGIDNVIIVYPHIYTCKTGKYDYDFAPISSGIQLNFKDVGIIRVTDYLEYDPGVRLFELSEQEFDLVKIQNPRWEEIYDYRFSENAKILLLSWNDDADLKAIASKIAGALGEIFKDVENEHQLADYRPEADKYIRSLKNELPGKKVLLLVPYTAL